MDVERYKSFFFEAMNAGWANDQARFTTKEFDGWKEKTWVFTSPKFDNFQLVDQYRTFSGSRVSEGRKSISYNGMPVWYMVYGGWYDKSVIPFLKLALRYNYEKSIFLGGRGPRRLEGEDDTLQYCNWNAENDFRNFNGYEQITKNSEGLRFSFGQKVGEHHYFGGTL